MKRCCAIGEKLRVTDPCNVYKSIIRVLMKECEPRVIPGRRPRGLGFVHLLEQCLSGLTQHVAYSSAP